MTGDLLGDPSVAAWSNITPPLRIGGAMTERGEVRDAWSGKGVV